MTKTVAWIVNRLDAIGGGERLLFEGAQYYRSNGYKVIIITWFFDEISLFNGKYENLDIIQLTTPETARKNIFKRAFSRGKSIFKLRRILKQHNADPILVQGEYDVALVYLATLFTSLKYNFLIFGQTFQYPHDYAKYSYFFKPYLKTIVNSCQGYRETTPLIAPKMSLVDKIANELICLVRLRAVRKAAKRFSFSKQVQWETKLIYKVPTILAKGAFHKSLLKQNNFPGDVYSKYNIPQKKYILSMCRLDAKKRIDILICAFAKNPPKDYVLVIGGKGYDRVRLEKIADQTRHRDKIIFAGAIDEGDLLTLKANAQVSVSLDIGDFDIAPLESLATNTKVICPTEFETDEVLEHLDGFYITRATVDDVSKTLYKAIESKCEIERSKLEYLSWEHYFDQILETK